MKKLISQVAGLVGAAAETVARSARKLSGKPESPAPAPSAPTAPLVHLIACESCHAQYDVTGHASTSLRCRCGHLMQVRAPTFIQRTIERCGACGGPLKDGAQACGFCGGQVEREARALTLLCPECFAANPRRGQFCCSCGVALAPEPVGSGEPSRHACPVCAVPLFQRRLLNGWVEECHACHGFFIAATHFEHLVRHAHRPDKPAAAAMSIQVAPPSDVVVYRRCPECDQLMQRRNYGRVSGVVVDECRRHGHWLDANELEAIARFISSGEQERARKQEARDAQRAAEDARHRASLQRIGGRRSVLDALWGDDD